MPNIAIAKEIDSFTVSDGQRTVFASSAGASWAYVCSDEDCPARTCIGFENAGEAGSGAVGHLRWHASGCRFCAVCDTTLLPDSPGDRCRPGACYGGLDGGDRRA